MQWTAAPEMTTALTEIPPRVSAPMPSDGTAASVKLDFLESGHVHGRCTAYVPAYTFPIHSESVTIK
jgi:hypothetical protein